MTSLFAMVRVGSRLVAVLAGLLPLVPPPPPFPRLPSGCAIAGSRGQPLALSPCHLLWSKLLLVGHLPHRPPSS